MDGKVLLGVSAEVILDKEATLIRYRDEKGRVLATQLVQGVQYGDAITIPFYGDVTMSFEEECRECNRDIQKEEEDAGSKH